MYKRASESAQEELHGRGKLSGVGKPTVIMTGPVPINKQTLKNAPAKKRRGKLPRRKKPKSNGGKKTQNGLRLSVLGRNCTSAKFRNYSKWSAKIFLPRKGARQVRERLLLPNPTC